jgi:hypothetical protein
MWRFVQDRSHGRNGGIRSFAAFPPNILNLNGKSGSEQVRLLASHRQAVGSQKPVSCHIEKGRCSKDIDLFCLAVHSLKNRAQ